MASFLLYIKTLSISNKAFLTLHKRSKNKPDRFSDGHRRQILVCLPVQAATDFLQTVQDPGHDEESQHDNHPHHRREWVQELEVRRLVCWDSHQNGYMSRHERLGEVYSALAVSIDGQRSHRHCGILWNK